MPTFNRENLFDSKDKSLSIPNHHIHRKDSSSSNEKYPHSSFQSPNIETYPKNIRLSSSYSLAYHVPDPVGLKNLQIIIGSASLDWFQILRNCFISDDVMSFIRKYNYGIIENRWIKFPNKSFNLWAWYIH